MGIWNIIKGDEKATNKQATKPAVKAAVTPKVSPAVAPKVVSATPTKPTQNKKITSASWQVIVGPVVSEKSTRLGIERKVVFNVVPEATKARIKRAVQEIYGVTPVAVNTKMVVVTHQTRGRKYVVKKTAKQAIVTLKEGDQIDITKIPALHS